MIDAIPEDPGGGAANTAMDDDDDDNDDVINDDEEEEAAAAEVETHGHTADGNARRGGGANAPADQAVMGAVQDQGTGDGVANFEVTDESGSLVQQRFLQFLTD
jgi:hypothetical protein